jgi:hypothetical protein
MIMPTELVFLGGILVVAAGAVTYFLISVTSRSIRPILAEGDHTPNVPDRSRAHRRKLSVLLDNLRSTTDSPDSCRVGQITRLYFANWYSLRLTVEEWVNSWTVRIQYLGARKPLYETQRCSLDAAKCAGIEFAAQHVLRAAGKAGPERCAANLVWNEERQAAALQP